MFRILPGGKRRGGFGSFSRSGEARTGEKRGRKKQTKTEKSDKVFHINTIGIQNHS